MLSNKQPNYKGAAIDQCKLDLTACTYRIDVNDVHVSCKHHLRTSYILDNVEELHEIYNKSNGDFVTVVCPKCGKPFDVSITHHWMVSNETGKWETVQETTKAQIKAGLYTS